MTEPVTEPPSIHERTLRALRDLKRRLAHGERLEVSAALTQVSVDAFDLERMCHRPDGPLFAACDEENSGRFIGARKGGAQAIFFGVSSPEWALRGAVDAIARCEFPRATVALAFSDRRVAAVIKSIEQAAIDGEPVRATLACDLRSSLESAHAGVLMDALEQLARGAMPEDVLAPGISLRFPARADLSPRRLLKIAAEVLGVPADAIAADRSWFDYGLDSRGAVEVRNRLQAESGLNLPLTVLFDYTTAESLASFFRVSRESAASSKTSLAVQEAGPWLASHGQSALWAIYRAHPDDAAYNLRCAMRLDPSARLETISEAIRLTVAKHPILSAHLTESGDEIAHVFDPLPARVEVLDTWDWTDVERDRWIERNSLAPFDLASGSLIRFLALNNRRGSNQVDAFLLIVVHHAVADFTSLKVLLNDIHHFYGSLISGQTPEISSERRFLHHALRERKMLETERAALVSYWREALGEPLAARRPDLKRCGGVEYQTPLEPDLSRAVFALAKSLSATMYQILFTSFALLLLDESNENDLLIGTTVSRRELPGEQDAIGYFVNPVPVRFERSTGDWTKFFESHQARILGSIRAAALPFALLVRELAPPSQRLRTQPVFQTMFTWLAKPELEPAGPFRGELLREGHHPAGVTHDLILMVSQSGDDLHTTWCYQSSLYKPADIERLNLRYRELLREAACSPALTQREETLI